MSEAVPAVPVSYFAPAAGCRAHRAEIEAAVARVLDGGSFVLGEETRAFENEFAAFVGTAFCVGVASGTDAIELALRACGIGPGDAVLAPAFTAVATVVAIERAGARPVLCDVEADTFNLDPRALEETIADYLAGQGNRAGAVLRAVIPVHLFGHPAALPEIEAVARRHGLRLIEDCAQSHGAQLAGRMTGAWGDLAAFSFYPTKNLGALGDGGAVATSDAALAARLRLLREYGWQPRQVSQMPGLNSRLDELQAAVLRVKLRYLAAENARRRQLAARYDALLAGLPLQVPVIRPCVLPVYHQYVIRTPNRDRLRDYLQKRGFPAQVHYPLPVHLQPAYQGRLFIGKAGLPRAEAAARQVLSLPLSPFLEESRVEAAAACLRQGLQEL